TGGSAATDQEVRNCILVMINKDFFTWFASLAKNESFRRTNPLSDRQLQEKFDMELVARFLCLRTFPTTSLREISDLGPFLTDRLSALAQDPQFDRRIEEAAFTKTFRALDQALGEDSFRKYSSQKRRATGPPLVSVFEILALG